MKILNVCQCTNLGGMEQASRRLMIALQARGHSFDVLSLNPLGDLKPLLDEAGIPARGLTYGGRGGWRSWAQVRRELREAKADALLMTGHHLLTMLALGRRWEGRRVLTIHYHHRGVKPDWQWQLIYRLAYQRFEAVVFPTEFIRREAEEIYPSLRHKSRLIRYPVDLPEVSADEQRQAARQALNLPPHAPVVGNAGWLITRKRWDVFLKTAARITVRCPEARFVVAGDGPLRGELRTLADALGLRDKVVWLGWQSRLDDFYRSLDVLLFNSDWDALGLTPLEAMSHGVPVAASVEHGGLVEYIEDRRVGFLLPTHDVAALADQVSAWLNDPVAAREVGTAGRQLIGELGRGDRIAAAYEGLFQDR